MEQEPLHMVYSEEDYLEAIRENAPATTQEVADTVGVTRQGADYRLRKLEDNGLVSSEMLGNTLIWTVNDR
ncbi:helix-turn-helix domain-containing protein [Natrinema sp. SYSU A 869]|uniref:winged helix-turn-helix domain-containing protein n=1 Tax=Natrinema sp. SYSU A 869 TaxID=2871694 RepID=UPI001CA39132|nr:helix-turn-helix domain-containing protein [Natrinema sp. SYSU A 869]